MLGQLLEQLVQLPFLLVKILDESASSFLHLMKPALKPFIDTCGRSFNLSPVLGVPDVVSNEFLNFLLLFASQVLFSNLV